LSSLILNHGGFPLGITENELKLVDLGVSEGASFKVLDDTAFKGAKKYANPSFAPKKNKKTSNYKAIIDKQNVDGSYDKKILPELGTIISFKVTPTLYIVQQC
jgi:hypothetical protein